MGFAREKDLSRFEYTQLKKGRFLANFMGKTLLNNANIERAERE